jgi:hypothetical protein
MLTRRTFIRLTGASDLMFYAPNMTSADVGSDGTPASPVFVVDEKTPHALMIVPVPAGSPGSAGHVHPSH